MSTQWSVLARYPDFRRLFAGSSVSMLGSNVTVVALPLTAVVYLHASPIQMGALGAMEFLPHLVLGLPAGVWVSRLPYRRLPVATDLAQMLLLGAIPVLATLHVLSVWQLYVIVLLVGICTLFDAIAANSFTPVLVPADQLLPANSAMALSASTVSTSGAGIGGALVQLLTAPVAIAVDAASFLVSALCKARIRHPGPPRITTTSGRQHLGRDILEGLKAVIGHPIVRAVTVSATLGALAGQMQAVIVVLFLVRDLHISSALVGVAVAITGAAGIIGSLLGVPITTRIGHGPAFIAGQVLAGVAGLVMAVAAGPYAVVLLVLLAAQMLRGWGPALYGINQRTIRQIFIPPELMSRAQATWRFLVYGGQPIGALLGGVLAATAGFRATLVISSVLMFAAAGIALASPLRNLRTLPEEPPRPSQEPMAA